MANQIELEKSAKIGVEAARFRNSDVFKEMVAIWELDITNQFLSSLIGSSEAIAAHANLKAVKNMETMLNVLEVRGTQAQKMLSNNF
jgi:hypothetical protein